MWQTTNTKQQIIKLPIKISLTIPYKITIKLPLIQTLTITPQITLTISIIITLMLTIQILIKLIIKTMYLGNSNKLHLNNSSNSYQIINTHSDRIHLSNRLHKGNHVSKVLNQCCLELTQTNKSNLRIRIINSFQGNLWCHSNKLRLSNNSNKINLCNNKMNSFREFHNILMNTILIFEG